MNNYIKPIYWDEACDFLSQKDPILAKLIDSYKGESLQKKHSAFHTLARAIIGQQISVKAADSIWLKFENLLNFKVSPDSLLSIDDESLLKEIGLSRQKILYLNNIAEFLNSRYQNQDDLSFVEKQIIQEELIEIKGVGSWTVEMFMIFHINSPDILPIKDIGLLKAVNLAYSLNSSCNKELAQKTTLLSQKWSPYRTVATWYLWRSIDPVPVEY